MILAAGMLLALVLGALVVAALVTAWRAPFRALGVLVAGVAVHNLALMLLLRTDVPVVIVRVLQAWKEGVLALLALMVLLRLLRAARDRRLPRLIWPDYFALALGALLLIYVVVPVGAHFTQRAFDFRTLAVIPVLYAFGRVFWPPRPSDVRWTLLMIIGAAALVGLVGMVELWFVPTSTWLVLGVNQFNAWLGHTYKGPAGLPPNFFQTSPNDVLLRRMVSTYISPLGIAYTALLVLPASVAWWAARTGRRRATVLAGTCLALIVLSVVFSLTRLAMGLMVLELALLALLLPGKRTWVTVPVALVGVLLAVFGYFYVGPTNARDLHPIREPAGYALLIGREQHPVVAPTPTRPPARPGRPRPTPVPGGLVSTNDPSLLEHLRALRADLKKIAPHPLGLGLGTFVPRFEAQGVTGESAVFWIIAELGVLGGLAFAGLYAALLLAGWRAFQWTRDAHWEVRSLPLIALAGGLGLIPIILTSDLWGDLSVTYLLCWVTGATVSLAWGSTRPDLR